MLQVPPGYSLLNFAEIDSTNTEALRQAENGASGPLWILAEHQDQGRGRRGRKWIEAPGNLFATLLLSWQGPTQVLSDLSFVTAIACAQMLKRLVVESRSSAEIRLKWPNDILINGAKAGGILIETSNTRDTSTAVAIGIGLNVASHPAEVLGYPTTDFVENGIATDAKEVFEKLAVEFDHWFALWQGGAGFNTIKQHWLEFGPALGQELRVNTGDDIVTGEFAGLDDRGGLQMRLSDGSSRIILAGDILGPTQEHSTGMKDAY